MSFLVLNTFEAGFMADFCFLLVFKASQFACEIRSFPMYAMYHTWPPTDSRGWLLSSLYSSVNFVLAIICMYFCAD